MVGSKKVEMVTGGRYALVIRNSISQRARAYLIRQKSGVPLALQRFLAGTRTKTDGKILRIDPGGEITSLSFAASCDRNRIRGESTWTNVPALDASVERGNCLADTMQKAPRVQVSITFAESEILKSTESLRGKPCPWAVHRLNRSSILSNHGR